MTQSWRKRIDKLICKKMEAQGFQLVDKSFTYMKDLSFDVDVVVEIRQGFPYSAVQFADVFINLGVIHKELAELEMTIGMSQKSTLPPPHWGHSVDQCWLIAKNLNALVPELSMRLKQSSSIEEITTVTDAVVETVVQIGLPLAKRFDNIQSLVQELESPSDPAMRCQGLRYKLPLAYMLNGQFDRARLSLQQFSEQDSASGLNSLYFDTFVKNLSVEIARREADQLE